GTMALEYLRPAQIYVLLSYLLLWILIGILPIISFTHSKVKRAQMSFMHNKWLKDLHYEFLTYAKPVGLGVYGISVSCLDVDDLKGRDKDGNLIGNFGAKDLAAQLAYGLMTDTNLSIGASLKLIKQKIESEKACALAFDIGLLYHEPLLKNLSFAFVIQNIGTKLKFIHKREDLPVIYRAGISYKMLDDRLILAADLTQPADNDCRINLGTEYILTSNLALRCGYTSKNDLDNGFSFGAGFKFNILQLDYAYVPYGNLENTHRISVSFYF
ncbi:MAG: PorV/PorQ family protein, partial [bacterium]